MRPALRVGAVYDFRNTPESGMDMPSLYAAIMDQIVMLEGLGLDLVWFTEHHFVEDGYLPSWIPVAGAMAARTTRVRFSSDVCLLPFSHPVRLAEDLAVLDNLSGGRIEVGVGMGYAPHEFRGFGIPLPQRVSACGSSCPTRRGGRITLVLRWLIPQFSRAALAITSMASGCRDRTLSESAPLSSQAR